MHLRLSLESTNIAKSLYQYCKKKDIALFQEVNSILHLQLCIAI